MTLVRLSAVALALVVAGCARRADPKKDNTAKRAELVFPVEVARAQVRAVEYVVDAVGSLDAFETVQVTPRVAGVVERVRFREGDRVKAGQVLVDIEPLRFTLAVKSAEATLARAVAARADAERGFSRRQKMSAEGVASVEELESFRTKLDTARADEAAAKAALDLAKLNLHDAFVAAPIDGVVQTRTVQTGQYVMPGAMQGTAVLATLVRRDPLLLRFKVAEQEAANVTVGSAARFSVREVSGSRTARIRYVAARADDATRMVDVVAEVAQDEAALRPGAFAQVQVPSGSAKAAVVPQTAVRPSERGFLAYVVDHGNAAERIVQIGRRTADGEIEVLSGLSEGDLVVVRGAEALSPGARVKIADKQQNPVDP